MPQDVEFEERVAAAVRKINGVEVIPSQLGEVVVSVKEMRPGLTRTTIRVRLRAQAGEGVGTDTRGSDHAS